ncbi:MAG: histidine kinase [Holophagaceae bacterium]|nr:histidine kinase [Holophagaceae bacterium]
MHPILTSRTRLLAYLLLWVPLGGLLAGLAVMQGWTRLEALALAVPMAVLGAGLYLSPYYLCRVVNVENQSHSNLAIIWGFAAVIDAGLWSGTAWGVARFLGRFDSLHSLPLKITPALPVLWSLGVVLYLATAAFYYLLIALQRAQKAEAEQLQLRMLAQEAELKALRAQLNPHFLFNSLNSISALTTVDPKRAREMCLLLSDFLRKSLGLGERRQVALREELDLVRAYLSIEQIRFGERLKVAWDIAPEAEGALVPTLLLQPLVENAIKHGISALPEGGELRLQALAQQGTVTFTVDNPANPDTPVKPGLGLGLRQVRQRLWGRFPDRCRFESEYKEGRHRVVLAFPLETEP